MKKNQIQNMSKKKSFKRPVKRIVLESPSTLKKPKNNKKSLKSNFLPLRNERRISKIQKITSMRNQILPIKPIDNKFIRSSKNFPKNYSFQNQKNQQRKSSIRNKRIVIAHNSISNLNKSSDIKPRNSFLNNNFIDLNTKSSKSVKIYRKSNNRYLPEEKFIESNKFLGNPHILKSDNANNNFFPSERLLKKKNIYLKTESSLKNQDTPESLRTLKKELYDLKKELKAEKDQKEEIMKLNPNNLIVIEEIATKKIYGKKKDIRQKLVKAEILTRKYKELNHNYKESERTIKFQKSELEKLRQRCQFLENNNNNKFSNNVYKERVIETKIVENNKFDLEKEKLKNESFLNNIKDLEVNKNKLILKVEQVKEKNKKLKKDLLKNNLVIENLKKENENHLNFFETSKESSNNQKIKFELEEKDFIINDLKKKIGDMEINLKKDKEIKNKKNESENKNQNLENKLRKKERELKLRNSNILNKEEEIEKLKYLLEEYKHFKNEKNSSKEIFEKEILSLKNLLDFNKEIIIEKNSIIKSFVRKEQEFSTQIDDLKKKIEITQKKLNKKNNEENEEKKIHNKNLLKEKIDEIEMLKSELSSYERNVEILQNKLRKFEKLKKNSNSEKEMDIEGTYQRILDSEFNGEYSNEVKTEEYVTLEDEDNLGSLENDIIKIENCYDYEEGKNNYNEIIQSYEEKIKFLESKIVTNDVLKGDYKDKNLENMIKEIRIDIINIIKNLPDTKPEKIFNGDDEYFQELCHSLKIINSKLLQVDLQNIESKKTMEKKQSKINIESDESGYIPNNEMEENGLTTLNQQLSDKILTLYSQISKLEKEILKRDQKIKKQNYLLENKNNGNNEKLTKEIERLKKERDDIREKEINMRNQILRKKQNMLNELNSFVSTKKQFESSFLSEITKVPK